MVRESRRKLNRRRVSRVRRRGADEDPSEFFHNHVRRQGPHTGVAAGCAGFAVQRTRTAGQRSLEHAVVFPCGEEAPFPAGGAEQRHDRRGDARGQMHGARIAGDQRVGLSQQRDKLAQIGAVGEVQRHQTARARERGRREQGGVPRPIQKWAMP